MGEFRLGDHGGYLLSPPGRWSGFWTLDWCGRGGAAPGSQSPLMEEQEGPVWCLNGPRAGLGEISWMGAYLPEVNSAVGFGSMLMRPRLYKGQLVSFCSLYYKPPPISAQTSCKCRKEGGGGNDNGLEASHGQMAPQLFLPTGNFCCHHSMSPRKDSVLQSLSHWVLLGGISWWQALSWGLFSSKVTSNVWDFFFFLIADLEKSQALLSAEEAGWPRFLTPLSLTELETPFCLFLVASVS